MSSLEKLAQDFDYVYHPRRTYCGNFKYSTSSILTCSFCATMAGYHGTRFSTDFMADNYDILNLLPVYHMAFQVTTRLRGSFQMLVHNRWPISVGNGLELNSEFLYSETRWHSFHFDLETRGVVP